MSREIIYTDDFVSSASARLLWIMQRQLSEGGPFILSLCGGNTPRPVYERVARDGASLPWERVFITFGDERCVPPDNEQSNYRMATQALLKKVSIPPENVLRVRGELKPDDAAADYEQLLDETARKLQLAHFRNDLILLGMGDDGHTASLFPDTKALAETKRRVIANRVPKLNSDRITFTFPFINDAETVMFLVNDSKKRSILETVLSSRGDYPASKVIPTHGDTIWMLGNLL